MRNVGFNESTTDMREPVVLWEWDVRSGMGRKTELVPRPAVVRLRIRGRNGRAFLRYFFRGLLGATAAAVVGVVLFNGLGL